MGVISSVEDYGIPSANYKSNTAILQTSRCSGTAVQQGMACLINVPHRRQWETRYAHCLKLESTQTAKMQNTSNGDIFKNITWWCREETCDDMPKG